MGHMIKDGTLIAWIGSAFLIVVPRVLLWVQGWLEQEPWGPLVEITSFIFTFFLVLIFVFLLLYRWLKSPIHILCGLIVSIIVAIFLAAYLAGV